MSNMYKSNLTNLLKPTKNRQPTRLTQRTISQPEMTAMLRNASTQSTHNPTKTAWWKLGDEHDNNRNVPAVVVLDSDKMSFVNRQHNSRSMNEPTDHVVDNFRFVDADRKWTQNQPRYVDENIKRHVRSYRRVKSLDEDSDNANDDHDSVSNHNFESTAFQHSRDTAITSNNVKQQRLSTLKRSRSRWTSGPLLRGRNIEEQRAIDDLLSLDNDNDRSMDVDNDNDTAQPVQHNYGNEFVEISNELQHLCLYHDDSKTRTDFELTASSSSRGALNSFQSCSEMLSTSEKEICDKHYSVRSSEVPVQLLVNKNRSDPLEDSSHATRIRNVTETVGNESNIHCWNSVLVSQSGSVSRQEVDQHRSTLYEVDRSKLALSTSVNSLSPLSPPSSGLTSEVSTNLCLLKSNFTSSAVSISYLLCIVNPQNCSLYACI